MKRIFAPFQLFSCVKCTDSFAANRANKSVLFVSKRVNIRFIFAYIRFNRIFLARPRTPYPQDLPNINNCSFLRLPWAEIFLRQWLICAFCAVYFRGQSTQERASLGLATEFRSEKIPRNRLGMASVIPRKKVLIPRHSESYGRVNSEAWNGRKWHEKN